MADEHQPTLTLGQYNAAVDLWNAGHSLGEIAAKLDVGIYAMHPISRAVTREALRMNEAAEGFEMPVRLERVDGE